MDICDSCAAGPKGIEGHGDLRVQSMSASHLAFRCFACGRLWSRNLRVLDAEALTWTGPLEDGALQALVRGVRVPLKAATSGG